MSWWSLAGERGVDAMRWRGGCPIAAPLLWLSGSASTAAAAVDEDEEGGEVAPEFLVWANEVLPPV